MEWMEKLRDGTASVLLPDQLSWFQQDPKERMGCQVETGFTDIKSHTFFRSIDWEEVRLADDL